MKYNAKDYLTSKVKEYYDNNYVEITDLQSREFGYGVYGKKIAGRHLEFKSNAHLNSFIRRVYPFYISYSSTYYKYPSARPMDKKEFLGADLVFEFDADDIPTACKKEHDSWSCKCGESGAGNVSRCPNCSAKPKVEEFFCDKCINATLIQTKKLYNIFTNELKIPKENIQIMFSGHKGYHIKIKSENIYPLNKKQRLEIMNYISEEGLNFKQLGFIPDNRGSIKYVGLKIGKGYKYLDYVIKAIRLFDKNTIKELFKTNMRNVNKLLEKKDLEKNFKEGIFPKLKEDSTELWYNFLQSLLERQKIYIDKQTTGDIRKIIRAENTIHGGSMLLSKVVDYDKLDDFRPFYDAATFRDGTIKVHFKKIPKLLIDGKEIGPFEDKDVELPTYIGLYFLAKGDANAVIL